MDTNSNNKLNLKLRISTFCRDRALSDTNSNLQITTAPSNPKVPPTHLFPPDPARQKLSESYSLFYSARSAPMLEKQSMHKNKKKRTRRRRRRRRRRSKINNVSCWLSSEEEEADDALLINSQRRRPEMKKMDHHHHQMDMVDSYAVVKSSIDPYMDFRMSMVEMIVEKKMKKAEDLERLLQCFLKLNSYRHHPIIIEAFMEIWDALFL